MAIERRNHQSGCRPCYVVGKATSCAAIARAASRTRGVKEPEHARNCSLYGNREIPEATERVPRSVRSGQAEGCNPDMNATGKSDSGVVSVRQGDVVDVVDLFESPQIAAPLRRPSHARPAKLGLMAVSRGR